MWVGKARFEQTSGIQLNGQPREASWSDIQALKHGESTRRGCIVVLHGTCFRAGPQYVYMHLVSCLNLNSKTSPGWKFDVKRPGSLLQTTWVLVAASGGFVPFCPTGSAGAGPLLKLVHNNKTLSYCVYVWL